MGWQRLHLERLPGQPARFHTLLRPAKSLPLTRSALVDPIAPAPSLSIHLLD